jgi:hypothetical protein
MHAIFKTERETQTGNYITFIRIHFYLYSKGGNFNKVRPGVL